MQPFRRLTGIAAPLPIANVDTDMILSAKFLKTVSRAGLGKGLFHALRADPGFVLNRTPWDRAKILIAHENFGCGSSREHAPWALLDFGITCIIAPSFADIFHGNCFKNGILPIRLDREIVDGLMGEADNPTTSEMTVDLEAQTIAHAGGVISFDIDPQRRDRLLKGVDDIAQAMAFEEEIAGYETKAPSWLANPRLGAAL